MKPKVLTKILRETSVWKTREMGDGFRVVLCWAHYSCVCHPLGDFRSSGVEPPGAVTDSFLV